MGKSTIESRLDEIQEDVSSALFSIDKNSRKLIYDQKGELISKLPEKEKVILKKLNWHVGITTSRLLQFKSVIEHVYICFLMARKFPWHRTKITKSDHFYFVWFNFTNHCYVFRERAKKFLNQYNKMCQTFAQQKTTIPPFLKKIDSELRSFIKFRGQYVHEWEDHHVSYEHFQLVEMLNRIDPNSEFNLTEHYQDAKWDVKFEVEKALEKMMATFEDISKATQDTIMRCSNSIYPIYLEARDNGITTTDAGISLPPKIYSMLLPSTKR